MTYAIAGLSQDDNVDGLASRLVNGAGFECSEDSTGLQLAAAMRVAQATTSHAGGEGCSPQRRLSPLRTSSTSCTDL